MNKYIVMGVCALGLTVAVNNGFAESGHGHVSPEMEAIMFPDQSGEIYGSKNKGTATSSREHATTPADCVMSRSYPARSGGIELHKRLHINHDDNACR